MAYLVPGSVISTAIFSATAPEYNIRSLDMTGIDFGTLALFLLAAYIFGFLLQALVAGHTERWLFWFPEQRQLPSTFLISATHAHYSTAFKKRIALITRKLNGSLPYRIDDHEQFNLLYSRAVADGHGQLIEIFNALYALSRGLAAAFFFASVSLAASTALTTTTPSTEWPTTLFPWGFAAALIVASAISWQRARAYGVRFADEVYRISLTYLI